MFNRDPEKAATKAAQKQAKRDAKDELKAWRRQHPAEQSLNLAARPHFWPTSKMGVTQRGPILGGHAEFVDAGAHKAWTATRIGAGIATGGLSAVTTGRKDKGAAVINVTFGNGVVDTLKVKPEPAVLRAANEYVTAFNALANQLNHEAPPA